MPTGPITGRAQQTAPAAAPRIRTAATGPVRRWNVIADLTAVALLVIALLLPWNLYFGVGIPGSNTTLFAVLGAVTLLSILAVAVAGSWRSSGGRGRLRLALNVPYLLLVLAFVGFDAFETVRFGGTVNLPGGVGPGAWVGIAGALLSAQAVGTVARTAPPVGDDTGTGWRTSARIVGYVAMAAAALSFGYNLYWRVRYALQTANGSADLGKQNIAVLVTAVVYGLAALVAVLVATRWLLPNTRASRLATVALGASTLVAGIVVWVLPAGRDIDAFHGIAQNTSTAGVGFEGFLAWAAAAAIFAPRTLFTRHDPTANEETAWRGAARNGLLLIAVWCLGSMAMRLTDLGVAVTLNYPFSRYDSIVLATFDLGTAILALWLRVNLAKAAISTRLLSALCGLVATLSVARVVVGVALAPRFADSANSPEQHPVYGNDLAQQITSTFDVALCGLGLTIFAAAMITGQLSGRRLRLQRRRAARKRAVQVPNQVPNQPAGAAPRGRVRVGRAAPPSAQATTRIPTGRPDDDVESPTTKIPPMAGAPRIFRGDDSATGRIPVQQQPKIFRPPQT